MKQKRFVISLGGSIIVPDKGVDVAFLKKFRKFILDKVKEGCKFIIITGGGSVARNYIKAASTIANVKQIDNDYTGIAATKLNAYLLRSIFGEMAHPKIVEPGDNLKTKKNIIIGAGYKPGWSSDQATVLMAVQEGIRTVINLSNIDYVYDKDPRKYKDAKKLEKIDWRSFRKIVGGKWSPALSLPFDPIASRTAMKEGIRVLIINGRDLNNLDKYFRGEKFKGSVIG